MTFPNPHVPSKVLAVAVLLLPSAVSAGVSPAMIGDATIPTSPSPEFTEMGNRLYFVGEHADTGKELWRSDGTSNGTAIVKDIFEGTSSSNPQQLTVVGDVLYFVANDGTHGQELWRSDGTEDGTYLLKDIKPDTLSLGGPSYVWGASNRLIFKQDDPDNGNATSIWVSDGTSDGTISLWNPNLEPAASLSFGEINGRVFYGCFESGHGRELCVIEPNNALSRIKDINTSSSSASSDPENFLNYNGKLYFSAEDTEKGIELFTTDGTSEGTVRLEDINPGSSDANPIPLLELDGYLLFIAYDVDNNYALWRTDGSMNGATLVHEQQPYFDLDTGRRVVSLDGYMLYQNGTVGETADNELWRSGGTTGTTNEVKNIHSTNDSNPGWLAVFNDKAYFNANGGGGVGNELWISDGTNPGTNLFEDINPSAASQPRNLIAAGANLFFSANDGTNGNRLWTLDCTSLNLPLDNNVDTDRVYNCKSITAQNGYAIQSGVNVQFFATQSVNLGQEFQVADGASLRVVVN